MLEAQKVQDVKYAIKINVQQPVAESQLQSWIVFFEEVEKEVPPLGKGNLAFVVALGQQEVEHLAKVRAVVAEDPFKVINKIFLL